MPQQFEPGLPFNSFDRSYRQIPLGVWDGNKAFLDRMDEMMVAARYPLQHPTIGLKSLNDHAAIHVCNDTQRQQPASRPN